MEHVRGRLAGSGDLHRLVVLTDGGGQKNGQETEAEKGA
jgi:hypothetical protein